MQSKIKLTPAFLKELATDVLLDLDDQEIMEIIAIENTILQRFEKVLKINTEGIEPLFYPFETPRTYLRNDNSQPVVIDQSLVLANAPKTKGPYITITKVVK